MKKPNASTIRHAAKAAYQLWLTRGIADSVQCGLRCQIHCILGVSVAVFENDKPATFVSKIIARIEPPKAWAGL